MQKLLFPSACALCLALAAAVANAQQDAQDEAARRLLAEKYKDAQLVLLRITIQETIDTAETAVKTLAELKTESDAFNKHLTDLLTSDEGKRLAKDRVLYKEYRRISDQGPAPTAEIESRTKAVNSILESLKKDLKELSADYVPPQGFRGVIEKNAFWADDRLTLVKSRVATLDTLVKGAPALAPDDKVPTLKERMDDLDQSEVRLFAKIKSEAADEAAAEKERLARETAREAELLKVKEEFRLFREQKQHELDALQLQNEIERTKLQQQRDNLQHEVEDARVKQQANKAQKEGDIAKKELVAKCNDPEVKKLLAPFITPGYWQPVNMPNGYAGVRTSEKKPASLKVLQQSGLLTPGDMGIAVVIRAACSKSSDRPTWGYSIGNWTPKTIIQKATPEMIEKAHKAQDLLIELGPTLVELGMLSP